MECVCVCSEVSVIGKGWRMKATGAIFICLYSAALKVSLSLELCFHRRGLPFRTFLMGHHYPLNGTVGLLLNASSFASTLEWLILVASARCEDEKSAMDALWMFVPS